MSHQVQPRSRTIVTMLLKSLSERHSFKAAWKTLSNHERAELRKEWEKIVKGQVSPHYG